MDRQAEIARQLILLEQQFNAICTPGQSVVNTEREISEYDEDVSLISSRNINEVDNERMSESFRELTDIIHESHAIQEFARWRKEYTELMEMQINNITAQKDEVINELVQEKEYLHEEVNFHRNLSSFNSAKKKNNNLPDPIIIAIEKKNEKTRKKREKRTNNEKNEKNDKNDKNEVAVQTISPRKNKAVSTPPKIEITDEKKSARNITANVNSPTKIYTYQILNNEAMGKNSGKTENDDGISRRERKFHREIAPNSNKNISNINHYERARSVSPRKSQKMNLNEEISRATKHYRRSLSVNHHSENRKSLRRKSGSDVFISENGEINTESREMHKLLYNNNQSKPIKSTKISRSTSKIYNDINLLTNVPSFRKTDLNNPVLNRLFSWIDSEFEQSRNGMVLLIDAHSYELGPLYAATINAGVIWIIQSKNVTQALENWTDFANRVGRINNNGFTVQLGNGTMRTDSSLQFTIKQVIREILSKALIVKRVLLVVVGSEGVDALEEIVREEVMIPQFLRVLVCLEENKFTFQNSNISNPASPSAASSFNNIDLSFTKTNPPALDPQL